MPAEGLFVFVLGVFGILAAILWLSVPFILYSIRSSLQELQETIEDLVEIDLEIARRLGPGHEPRPANPTNEASGSLERPLRTEAPSGRPPAKSIDHEELSLRQQADQIRRRIQD